VTRVERFAERVGEKKRSTWAFVPCAPGVCSAKAVFSVRSDRDKRWHAIRVPLRRHGAGFTGTTWGTIATCNGRAINNAIAIRLTITSGTMISGVWRAAEWRATLTVRGPAVVVGNARCPKASYIETLTGTLILA
jgi:hypothetical protein